MTVKRHAMVLSFFLKANLDTIYGSNSMSFSTVCRWVRKCSADVAPFISAPKSGRSKSASSQIAEKIKL